MISRAKMACLFSLNTWILIEETYLRGRKACKTDAAVHMIGLQSNFHCARDNL